MWWLKLKGRKISTGETDLGLAYQFQLRKAAEVSGGDLSSLTAERVTLDSIERILTNDYRTRGHKTADRIAGTFERLRPFFGTVKPHRINEPMLTQYAATQKERGFSPGTINLDLSRLRRGFRLMMRAGMIQRTPHFPALRLDNARKGFFDRGDFDAVVKHLPEHLRPLLEVAYITGWRLASELLTRQWSHVDFEGGWLILNPGETKNRKGRRFPLTPALRTALETQRTYTDAVEAKGRIVPWVFHCEGQPIQSIRLEWEAARKASGQPWRLLHDLRRTAARNLLRAGVHENVIMKLCGWETRSMFERYAVVAESDLLEAAEKLAQAQGQPAKISAFRKAPGGST